MGRKTATGLPYLISRPDSGQYVYFRNVPAEVAQLVTGRGALDWKNADHQLSGKATIKISFSTGDLDTARVRWGSLHPHIEALVRLAMMRVERRTARPEDQRSIPRLSQDQVRAMAGQVEHDLLAADDHVFVDPTFTSPVADLLLRLSQGSGGRQADAAEIARRAAATIERRIAVGRLARRRITPVDRSIVQEEIREDSGFWDAGVVLKVAIASIPNRSRRSRAACASARSRVRSRRCLRAMGLNSLQIILIDGLWPWRSPGARSARST